MQQESKKFHIFDIKQIPYDFARLTVVLPALLYTRPKVIDVNGKPSYGYVHGGTIIAQNHTSFLDPLAVECTLWYRRKYSLAAEVIMDRKGPGFGLRLANCIRIDRKGVDLKAIKQTTEVLKRGRLLVVFPQGGIERSCEINELKSGIILMASMANAPILPLYTEKKPHWYSRMLVVRGEPFNIGDYCTKKVPTMKDIDELTHILQEKMIECQKVYREYR